MKGTGIDSLLKEIVKRLPEGEAMYPEDHLTDQPSRFLAAEILREKILHHTQQEVPHAVAVMVDTWVETPTLLKIAATIYVEKAGQKAILIGAGGAGLKKIGTLARYEMEEAFERKVFLQTFVKVKPNWRQDPEFLASIDWRSMMGQ
jgi:GTP-binding protein Era